MNKKHKRSFASLNYIKNLLILTLVVNRCVSVSDFAFLVGISIGITSSTVRLKIYAVTARITKYKPMIRKRKS